MATTRKSTTTTTMGRAEKHEFQVMQEKMNKMDSKIDRILRTLIGDEEMAQEGLVTKVQKHEDYIQSQKLLMAKVSGIAIGSGVLSNWLFEWISKLI
jgi:hypothetical protein